MLEDMLRKDEIHIKTSHLQKANSRHALPIHEHIKDVNKSNMVNPFQLSRRAPLEIALEIIMYYK